MGEGIVEPEGRRDELSDLCRKSEQGARGGGC